MADLGGDIILNRDSRLLQSRRRVARTLLILAFVFAACWLPYNIVQLVEDHLDQVQNPNVIKAVMQSLVVSALATIARFEVGTKRRIVIRDR